MMQYILQEPYALRGWDRLPYALVNTITKRVVFLNKTEFDALSICNGKIDAEHILVPRDIRDAVVQLERNGLVKQCAQDVSLKPWQEYRLYPSRYIQTAHWSVTGKCNYRCRHCYMSAPDAKLGELSHETCMDIVRQLSACGIMNVSLTGGEPLVRRDFLEIVNALVAESIDITTVYTNGKLVTQELLDHFKRQGIRPEFNLSFDGLGCHDWMRGVEGAEQAAVNAFELCRKNGFPLGAEITLHKGNRQTLRDTVNFLASYGVRSVKANPAALVGEWVKNSDGNGLTHDEVTEIYLEYIPYFFLDGSPLSLLLGGMFQAKKGARQYRVPAVKCPDSESVLNQCVCGHARLVMYIAPDGRALPCMSLSGMEIARQYPLITEQGLASCISDSEYMRLIDTRLSDYLEQNAECRACRHRYVCGAGCRASALDADPNNIMGPDRSVCKLLKGGWPEKLQARIAEFHELSDVTYQYPTVC